jgi:fibronectin type 3 domain-containing protein
MARRLPLLGLALSLAGCGAALDLEGARLALRGPDPPAAPLLREDPPADLPAPEGLRATSGELRSAPLAWDPVLTGDVAGYVIERALREKGDYQRVGLVADRFQTSFVDRGADLAPKAVPGADLGDGATYHYRVRAFDAAGSVSRAGSASVRATTAPPPARPEALRAFSHQAHKIALAWQPTADATVAGYVIFRSPSLRGDYQPIARVEGPHTTTYVDRGLGPLRVFYYRVASVNAAGGEGLPTAAVRGVTKPEPLPPVGLRAESTEIGVVRLAFDRNVEPNVAGYRVLRARAETGAEELVAELGPRETEVVDRAVGAGERLAYRAVAVDRDGLVSAPSDAVQVAAASYGLEARAESEGVRLRWNALADGAAIRVLRAGRLRAREIARVRGNEYLDRDARPGRSYRYSVVLVREGGGEAPPSEPAQISLPPR